MGLREQKVEATRRDIVSAALELFGARGFDETTVEEIAERAVVAPRTIYRHFDSKESIVFAEFDDETERVIERLREHCRTGVSTSRVFDAFVDHFDDRQHNALFRTLARLTRENLALANRAEQWRRELAEGIASATAECEGRDEPSLADHARAAAVVAACATAITEWTRHGHEPDLAQLVRRAQQALT